MIAAVLIVVVLVIARGYLVINHSGGGTSAALNVPKVTVTTQPELGSSSGSSRLPILFSAPYGFPPTGDAP